MILAASAVFWRGAGASPRSRAGAERLLLASDMRMSTQRMSLAAFFIIMKTERDHFAQVLEEKVTLFEGGIDVFRNGDQALGLTPEEDPKVIKSLKRVQRSWRSLKPSYVRSLDPDQVTDTDIPNIVQHELTLFERTERLTEALVQAHGRSGLPLSLAVPIDVTGRLRALSQKMLKEALLIGLEYEAEDNRETLIETVTLFENTLKALLGELDGFSIPLPPGAIPIKLREVQIAWSSVKPRITEIVDAGAVTPAGLLTLSQESDRLLDLTQEVMDLYKLEAENLA